VLCAVLVPVFDLSRYSYFQVLTHFKLVLQLLLLVL